MSYFYELTEYPKIFDKTYWGAFDTADRTKDELEEIKEMVINRNNFIENYDIKQSVQRHKMPKKILDQIINYTSNLSLFDHVECYKTYDNEYYMVNSPYVNKDSEKDKKIKELGFKMIDPLYFKDAITYIKKIEPIVKIDKDYYKRYYHEKRKAKIQCEECDGFYSLSNKSKHMMGEKHLLNKKCNDLEKIAKFLYEKNNEKNNENHI